MAGNNKTAVSKQPVDLGAVEPFAQQGTGLAVDITGKTPEEIARTALDANKQNIANIQNIGAIISSPYGMFRSVPILCRKDKCAYKYVCMVPSTDRIEGQRCPMEVAAILARFMQWCDHFGIVIIDNTIAPKDLVDASLIRDLVTIEIQQMRGENKIAISGDFIGKTVLEVDKQGTPYYGNEVSPEAEHLLNLQQKKEKILNQLNATRKDKAQDKRNMSPSEEAVKLFQKIKEMESGKKVNGVSISDVEFDEDGNIIENAVIKEPESEEKEKPEPTTTRPEATPVNIETENVLDSSWNAIDFSEEGE